MFKHMSIARTILVASTSCLPSIFVPAYDLIGALRNTNHPLVGGFHPPLERECLDILLSGSAPVIVCPARQFDPARDRLYPQHGVTWKAVKAGLVDGRVTIVEPPGMIGRRITRPNAAKRNEWLLGQADRLLLLYASPGGETERVVRLAIDRGIPVSVLDHPANARWLELGATVWASPEGTSR